MGVKWTCQRGCRASQCRTAGVGVLSHRQMDIELAGDLGFKRAQELEELPAAVARQALGNEPAGGDVQRREQRGRAVAHVVVGASLDLARSGRERSRAWIWLFSSTQSTSARSGGSR